MLLIIFLFYKQMEEPIYGGSDALASLKGELFSGKMTVFLFIQVGFIIFERYLFLMNPKEWTNWETFKQAREAADPRYKILRRITRGLQTKPPKEKLAAVFRRVSFLLSLYNLKADDFLELVKESNKELELENSADRKIEEDYVHNPLYKRLTYIRVLMVVFYSLMFLYFPLAGNYKTNNSLLCNSFFQPTDRPKCNMVSENTYIQLLYITTTFYFILCALQIRHGESFLKNQKKKDRRWTTTEKLTNTIVTKVPFVFEIKTALDFAVTKTSLGLFEWFKFEDIYNSFFSAKYAQISSDMKKLGEERSKVEKIVFGWVALTAFLAIVLAPIFIFSSFNPDSVPNELTSIESTVGIKINLSKFVLYSNLNPKSIEEMKESTFNSYIAPYANKLTYKTNKIQVISLYPFGDSNWQITQSMYGQLQGLLLDTLAKQQSATMYLTLKITQLSGKSSLYTKETTIPPQTILTLQEILSKCSNNRLPIPGFYYQVLKASSVTGLEAYSENPSDTVFNKTVELKPVCNTQTNKTTGVQNSQVEYWNITSSAKTGDMDDPTNNGIVLFLILDNFSKSLAMFSSVVAMYTGFVLIIGNVIRGVFTGQTAKIWITDVAKAEQIIRICEGVTAARIEGDTVREEVLYWELLDIMRSPEMIKLITDNNLEHKQKLEKVLHTQ